jgi:methylated-DNA-[protein]-cysteine S-methyltransferase
VDETSTTKTKDLSASLIPPGASVEARARQAARLVVERAAREGLLDVAYGFADSPFGKLLVATTPRGLVRLAYPDRRTDDVLSALANEISPRVLESPQATDEIRRELEEYFDRKRRSFTVPVDLSHVHGFSQKVLRKTARIPFGSVATYRDVATKAGSPGAVRAAGNALGANPVPIVVPCHRVVRTGGGLGGYTGGLGRKMALLELEGVSMPRPVRVAPRLRQR